MRNYSKKGGLLLMAMAMVSQIQGCATLKDANNLKEDTEAKINLYQPPKAAPAVQTVDMPYIAGDVIHPSSPEIPSAQNPVVTFKTSQPMALADFAQWVSDQTGIQVNTDDVVRASLTGSQKAPGSTPKPQIPGMPQVNIPNAVGSSGPSASSSPVDMSVSVSFHGRLNRLLDTVATKAGIWWRYKDGEIQFYNQVTRVFEIPALSWSTKSGGSIVASAGASASSSGSSTMGASSGSSGGGAGNTSTGKTEISMKSSVDFWSGLKKTAETVAGGGVISADSSSGTITVTGTPPQVKRVANWVQSITHNFSQQVAITVHVYNVKVNKEDNYGLNLAAAFQGAAQKYGFALTGAPTIAPISGLPMTLGANILSAASGATNPSQWGGTAVAVQALSTLGSVTQVFTRSAVTLNGQPAPMQVAQQTVYLAESGSTATANVGTTGSLIPGTVTTGFTALFLPHIADGQIYLGMNMTISNLDEMKTISGGAGLGQIQAPQTSNSTFQQSVRLKPGQSLMLTGYTTNRGTSTHNGVGSPYMPALGGGVNASTDKQMIAIVITARII